MDATGHALRDLTTQAPCSMLAKHRSQTLPLQPAPRSHTNPHTEDAHVCIELPISADIQQSCTGQLALMQDGCNAAYLTCMSILILQ